MKLDGINNNGEWFETDIATALKYVDYMTVDKYATLPAERQIELTQLRADARLVINGGV